MSDKQINLFGGQRGGKTRSTREAMKRLSTKSPYLISRGRSIAEAQAHRDGSTHSRKVRAEMKEKGLIAEEQSEFWIGAIFRSAEFEWTGEYYHYSDSSRNIHERTVKIWKLAA